MKKILSIFMLSAIGCQFAVFVCADTIITTDGKELKGIVVEEFKDRFTFSTPDGETSVMKSNIRELIYDSEEDNLVKLAEMAQEKREWAKAFTYYDMAFKINPNSKEARAGVVFLQGYLFRKESTKKEDDVKRMADLERAGPSAEIAKAGAERIIELEHKLRQTIGLALKPGAKYPEVESVRTGSPAYETGLRPGDRIIAIWGKLTGYMPLSDVIETIVEKSSFEVQCIVERTAQVQVNGNRFFARGAAQLIGAAFSMEFEGLTVADVSKGGYAEKAGINKGDRIVAINGEPTRYMPLDKAVRMIRYSRKNYVEITLRRGVSLWRTSPQF